MLFEVLLCKFLLLIIPTTTIGQESLWLKKGILGTVFSPYNKYHNHKLDYQLPEIVTMMKLVSKKFQKVTTYGMGTTSPSSRWNEGNNNAEGLSAFAAATLNKKNGSLLISMDIGIWQGDGDPANAIRKQEVENAFDAAKESNKLFPGTVTGLIMTTHWGNHQLDSLLQSITENENRSRMLFLDVGIRSNDCGSLRSMALLSHSVVLEIVKKLNFIVCHILPVGKGPHTNIPDTVSVMGDMLLEWREEFKKVNPMIRIIGQTGWPSQELSKEGVIGSVQNIQQFWTRVVKWSETHEYRVDMFTAFDEPFKWTVDNRAESHYGWWMRIKNDTNDPDAFIEKILYTVGKGYGLEIGLGLLGAFMVLIFVGIIGFMYIRLRAMQSQILTKADIDEFENGKPNAEGEVMRTEQDVLRLPYDRSYEIPKDEFIVDRTKLLGSGAFGTVYKGKLNGKSDEVAFKMTQSNCSSSSLKSLLSEIKIMIHVGKHPNVVSIIGAYTGEMREGRIMIAIELCQLGSLEKHLRANKKSNLTIAPTNDSIIYANDPTSSSGIQVEDLIKWSYQISCGMEHIASKDVIHADLAIRNILLTLNGTAKITDFGLSRRLYEYTNYVKENQEPLPWRWMAIESLQHMTFSTKSDVWAFGITLWEIFSLGDTPYPGLAWTVDFIQELQRGLRMNQPRYATSEIYSEMCDCWDDDPDNRPDFTILKAFFESLLQEVTK